MAASRSILLVLAAFLLLACSKQASSPSAPTEAEDGEASGAAAVWSYTITLDEPLEHMQLSLCIEGPRPRRLEAGRKAVEFVRSARVRGGQALRRDGRALVVDTLGEHGCIDLDIDLDALVGADGRDSARRGDSIMAAPELWLWRPGFVPANVDARARFELPEGVHATAPWPLEPDGWRRLDHTTFGWNAWIAFGREPPLRFTAAACEFEVAILDGEHRASDAGIQAWLTAAAESSAELHGRFPRERVAVVVVPASGWGRAPVLFGMARRGGGGSVMLLLDHDAQDDELLGEWVATHELLHLGLPLIADAWMAEGFVTYYTTVLRARQRLLTRREPSNPAHQVEFALEILVDGFARGHGGSRSLAHASETMRSSGAYARVYWGGAAVAFELDRSIRAASDNRHALDDLMRLIAPFAPEHRRWAAADLLALMDAELERWHRAGDLQAEISATRLAARLLDANELPTDIERLDGLAVEVNRGKVRLLDDPLDEVRVRAGLFEARAATPRN